MSFWAGVAKGFKDAKEAKAEQEELEARRAERQATFEYTKSRDLLTDANTKAFRDQQQKNWQSNYDIQVKTYEEGREDRLAREALAQENLEKKIELDEKWKNKEWGMAVEKFDFTKLTNQQAQEQTDKLYKLTIEKFKYGKLRDRAQDIRNNRAEARAIAESLRQIEITKFGQEMAEKNFNLREDQFEEQMRAAGVAEDLAQKGFDIKERAADLAYTQAVVDMIPSSLLGALSGDSGKAVPIGTNATVAVSKKFTANYNTKLTKQEQESPFFKAAIASPSAQASLQAFVDAQAKKGNEVQLNELPQYFSYLGQVEGKNEEEALEIVKDMIKGDGLENPEAMAKGLMVLKGYRPTEELFQQIGTPADANEVTKGEGIWKTAIANEARIAVDKITDEDKKDKVERALAFIKNDKDDARGYQILADLNYGMSIQSEFNLDKNPLVQSYYGEPVEAEVTVGGKTGGGTGSGDTQTDLSENSIGNPTVFNSPDDIQKARLKGFSGFVKMGNKVFEVDPYSEEENYPNNVPAGMGTTSVVTDEDREELRLEAMEKELAEMKKFEEEDNLKEAGAVEKVFDQQAEALSTMGKGVSDEQAEGNRPGEKTIDPDRVDRSFQGEGTVEEPMDLTEANAIIVSDKVFDVVDSIPPRTPKKNRVKWAMEEFKKRYKNATVHMSEDEIKVRIESLVNSNQ